MKVSSPVAAGALAIVSGGWPPAARPILAIRVADGSIAWRHDRGSPYTSTPLVYDGLVYILTDNGILSAYQVNDGVRVYQQRLSRDSGSFSASPVAAGGPAVSVQRRRQDFRRPRRPSLRAAGGQRHGRGVMATPAVTGSLLLVRTSGHSTRWRP